MNFVVNQIQTSFHVDTQSHLSGRQQNWWDQKIIFFTGANAANIVFLPHLTLRYKKIKNIGRPLHPKAIGKKQSTNRQHLQSRKEQQKRTKHAPRKNIYVTPWGGEVSVLWLYYLARTYFKMHSSSTTTPSTVCFEQNNKTIYNTNLWIRAYSNLIHHHDERRIARFKRGHRLSEIPVPLVLQRCGFKHAWLGMHFYGTSPFLTSSILAKSQVQRLQM